MKKLMLVLALGMLIGCGDSNYVEQSKEQRALDITTGIITPTAEDLATLDVYPISQPDGIIDIRDVVILSQNVSQPQ